MKILKASAGSGKTYELSKTYIDLLMSASESHPHRHILAVTFTNKATAEMKSRILRDLSKKAADDAKARKLLIDILHDYSAFSVSTIDRFFQQALKAFAREIGQFAAYQIELDRKSLVEEAMDRILDGLTEDKKDLVTWLRDSVMDKVEQGQRFSMDEGLHEMGTKLKSEEYRELREKYGIDEMTAFSKERLAEIRKSCRKVIKDFEKRVSEAGLEVQPGEKIKMPGKTKLKEDAGLAYLFGDPYTFYCTACNIDKLVFSLGLAGEFYKEFDALLKEKNVMPLDDSNTILRDIIDGSDAPFVYEKLGVRFEHFLLDEFQDTSRIQWANFLPLLRESESHCEPGSVSNLIVGDVKQSIYRWRDSDWRLLGEEVGREFPEALEKHMEFNWRSTKAVVNFNNDFFKFAAEKIGTKIYEDVHQGVKSQDSQDGCVRVTFTDDQLGAVLQSIQDVRDRGAEWSDIAVLVRSNSNGAEIAEALINENIPVISDDSLNVKSSIAVRRLVSLLSWFDNPANTVGSFLADSMNVKFPESFHSLVDLCEYLLRSIKEFDPAGFEGETLFVQAFIDDVQDWVGINGNNIRAFLKHWEESELCIGSPEHTDSVRIMTIHKSKGLEFLHVIFPFADKVALSRECERWCWLDASASPLGAEVNGIYPMKLSTSSENTLFAEDYRKEKKMQATDNINVFYVALTRAEKSLHVIAKTPTKKFREALDKGRPDYMNFAEMLYDFCHKPLDAVVAGQPYDFSRMERKEQEGTDIFPASFATFDLGDRLKASADALDFFGEDGNVGAMASARLAGIVLHGILSGVQTAEDLEGAVTAAVMDGQLDAEQGKKAFELLSKRIAAHSGWFRDGCGRNEVTVFGTDGRENRPDRVVCTENGTFIIDYKFGERKEDYVWQVRRYINLYKKMGYPNVRGAVWYVTDDFVQDVE